MRWCNKVFKAKLSNWAFITNIAFTVKCSFILNEIPQYGVAAYMACLIHSSVVSLVLYFFSKASWTWPVYMFKEVAEFEMNLMAVEVY